MRIGVDTRFLFSNEQPELRDFTKDVFYRLATGHPTDEFIFFTDTEVELENALPKNVSIKVLTPAPTNYFSRKWWFDIKLPYALKKRKADLFVGTYGTVSAQAKIPQLLIVRDLPKAAKGIFSNKGALASSIKKASAIACLSEFVRDKIASKLEAKKETIKVLGSGVAEGFKPLQWDERETIKERFASGCEYFVFAGGLQAKNNLLQVLQAFSIFKKWQKSNMKLVVTGSFAKDEKQLLEKLKTYKYRADVVLLKELSSTERASVIAAAYAMIYPSIYDGFALGVLEAMKANVAVIASANSSILELAGEAALYVDATKPPEIAEQMKKIFKDEALRNKLVLEGMNRAELYNWDKTVAEVWQAIEEGVSK